MLCWHQLEHLVAVIDGMRDHVEVRIMPFTAGAHPLTGSPITILGFDSPRLPDLLWQETISSQAILVGYDTQDLTGQQHDQLVAARSDGFCQVIVIGADTPHVELKVPLESFRLLDENDIVVGPATDGGYYLLGLRSGWDLVAGLDMGSRHVLDDLIVAATHGGYSVGFTEPTMDIDTAADLRELISRRMLHTSACPATCRAVQELGLWI